MGDIFFYILTMVIWGSFIPVIIVFYTTIYYNCNSQGIEMNISWYVDPHVSSYYSQ